MRSPRFAPAVCAVGAAAVLFGCGAREQATVPGDGGGLDIASPTTVSGPPSETAHQGDVGGAPHHADNRGWRQRAELSPADRARAEDAADRIHGALAPLRERGEFAPDAVASAIEDAGFPRESITTAPVRAPLGDTTGNPQGSAFGVHVGDAACVVGTIRPDRLQAEPKGSAAEYGCLEPATH